MKRLVAAALCAVMLSTLAACNKTQGQRIGGSNGSNGGSGEREKTEAEQAQDLAKEIAAQPWWRKKVTEAQVLKLADQVVALNKEQVLFVQHDGQSVAVSHFGHLFDVSGTRVVNRPEGIGERSFYVEMAAFSKRPDRLQALHALKSRVEKADFEQGK